VSQCLPSALYRVLRFTPCLILCARSAAVPFIARPPTTQPRVGHPHTNTKPPAGGYRPVKAPWLRFLPLCRGCAYDGTKNIRVAFQAVNRRSGAAPKGRGTAGRLCNPLAADASGRSATGLRLEWTARRASLKRCPSLLPPPS